MELRDSKFFIWYYENASKVFQFVFGKKRQKEFYEWLFWKIKKLKEKKLTNHHYEEFFTSYFGFTQEDYEDKKVMDIGCGPRGSLEWANMTSERIGLDTLADKYVKLEGKHHKMKYVQAGSEAIPFEDGYFDFVSSFNSLDHVDDLGKCIKEIIRVVKPGGYFLLISDIHSYPTICEPSAFNWDIIDEFKDGMEIVSENHFEGNLMYKSIREGVKFDHSNKEDRYGIITVLLKRK
ncbi:MAG: ubiquinone/menaquinone biosynthesis C-methylase UbiE [Glaciecola sp.]|jgi:ubiquinone/menaquinone biosynthesis C-methylase UbiE